MATAGAALFLLPIALSRHPVAAFLLLIPATLLWANEGVFMSWPATFLQGAAAATGVALINSIGNCGGMVGPLLMGKCSGMWHMPCTRRPPLPPAPAPPLGPLLPCMSALWGCALACSFGFLGNALHVHAT